MEKNQKIIRLLLVFIVAFVSATIFYIYRTSIQTSEKANVPIPSTGTRVDSIVKYRIDDNIIEPHQVFLTVTINTAVNQNGTTPNLTYPEIQLTDPGSNYIIFSPYTRWNGTDSLITTFKFRIIKDGVTYIKTGTERILCPKGSATNAYFYKVTGTKQFWRISNTTAGESPSTYFPRIELNTIAGGDPIIVSWPPTYNY